MITKLCARCQRIKPAAEFKLNHRTRDGLDSWCRICQRVATEESRRSNPRYEELRQEESRIRRGAHYDPIRYSRAVITHVQTYVERAIERFETNTGKEAPPHMIALRDVTRSFIAEHPEIPTRSRQRDCTDCGRQFTATPRAKTRVCPECRTERQRANWREKNTRRRASVLDREVV